ncbi:MAG: bifunctional diguanylate cyclase/phosphodiesterase [Acidimicrobiales bacterium]
MRLARLLHLQRIGGPEWALVVLAAAVGALLPGASRPVGVDPLVLPLVCAFVVVTALLTSAVLFQELAGSGAPLAVGLGCAYLYSAAMTLAYSLSLPGVASRYGVLGNAALTPPLIATAGKVGFGVVLLGGLAVSRSAVSRRRADGAGRAALVPMARGAAATLVLVAVVLLVILGLSHDLPALVVGQDYARATALIIPWSLVAQLASLGMVVWATNGARGPERWVIVAMGSAVCATILDSVAGVRYSAGWYGAWFLIMISGATVLIALFASSALRRWRLFQLFRIVEDVDNKGVDGSLGPVLAGMCRAGDFPAGCALTVPEEPSSGGWTSGAGGWTSEAGGWTSEVHFHAAVRSEADCVHPAMLEAASDVAAGIVAAVVRSGRPEWRGEAALAPGAARLSAGERSAGLRSALALPVMRSGRVCLVLLFGSPRPVVMASGLIGMATVLTARLGQVLDRQAVAEEQQRATRTDPLTGLANRGGMVEAVSEALARAEQAGSCLVVLALDIDRFRGLNRVHGRAVGDNVLRSVADRLRSIAGANDAVGRLDGDRFLACLAIGDERAETAQAAVRRARARVEGLYKTGHGEVSVEVSTGVTVASGARTAGSPEAGELLIGEAEMALDEAKWEAPPEEEREGRGREVWFREGLKREREARAQLEAELVNAVACGQIAVAYQPIVEVARGEIVEVEALVRWRHPTRGLLGAGEVLGAAESYGLMDAVGAIVLDEACRQAAAWQRAIGAGRHIGVSVNLSAGQLERPGLVEDVQAVLAKSGLPAGLLCLELTEGSLISSSPVVGTNLSGMKGLGCHIAIDDFGTGYASLTYLKRFPADAVKIDQSFVKDMLDDRSDESIVRAVIELARALGLSCIAEGVERPEQLRRLSELGCDRAQGYLISRPLLADGIEPVIRHGYALPRGAREQAAKPVPRRPLPASRR